MSYVRPDQGSLKGIRTKQRLGSMVRFSSTKKLTGVTCTWTPFRGTAKHRAEGPRKEEARHVLCFETTHSAALGSYGRFCSLGVQTNRYVRAATTSTPAGRRTRHRG